MNRHGRYTWKSGLFLSLLVAGCSDGLPPEKNKDGGDVLDTGDSVSDTTGVDGSAGDADVSPFTPVSDAGPGSPVPDTSLEGAITPPIDQTANPDTPAGDAGASADAAPGFERMKGDPSLTRGPGARSGGDVAPTVACEDLSGFYRDNAATVGLVPPSAPIDPSTTCGAATLYEPNDGPLQACAIPVGVTIESEFSSANDKLDHFKFEAQKGVTYTLDLVRSGQMDRSVTMAVGDQTMTLVPHGTIYGSGASHEEFTPALSGTVVLKFSGNSRYKFSVLPSTAAGLYHDALTYEPNNTPSTAAPICVGVPVKAEFNQPVDTVDHLTVQVVKGQTYTLRLTRINQLVRSVVGDAEGQTWLRETTYYGAGTTYEEFTPTATGPALITVKQGTAYELAVLPSTGAGLQQDPVTFEPNDSPSMYTPVAVGTSITSEKSSDSDVADYYGIDVEEGAVYELSLMRTGEFSLSVTMPRGAETLTFLPRTTRYGSGTTNEMFTAPFTGRVLVMVAATSGTKYTMRVSKL